MKSILISIGDELLIGQTVNTNATWMGTELNKIGIEVVEVLTISDQQKAIEDAMAYAEQKCDLVLLTGGLGPTKDDITKKTFSDFFNAPLIENKLALENVEGFFKKYGRPMTPVNKLQALVPAGSKMLLNKAGTAPGMWMENENAVFVSMPGVPSEMRYLMRNEVMPRLQKSHNLPSIVHQTMMTQGIGESYIADLIEDIEDGLPKHIKLAYLPSPGMVKLRLTGRGVSKEDLSKEIQSVFKEIKPRIKEHVYSDVEAELEEVVGELLKAKKLTIATAESCTGGLLASTLTKVPGSSAYFKGSVVAYANEIKQNVLNVSEADLKRKGAVSKEVVEQMALGVQSLMKTDYAIATSGIAGPDGGTEEKPVGTVWISWATPDGVESEMIQMGRGRDRVVLKTVSTALRILMLKLK